MEFIMEKNENLQFLFNWENIKNIVILLWYDLCEPWA